MDFMRQFFGFQSQQNRNQSVHNQLAPKKSFDRLGDLPLEIIIVISFALPLPALLALALTCRAYYHLCLPVLNHTVILTQQNVRLFRAKISSKDASLRMIQRVQIGRLDRPGLGGPWDFLEIRDILAALPNVHALELCGVGYLRGWESVSQILEAIAHLRELKTRVLHTESSSDATIDCKSSSMRSLDLTFVRPQKLLNVRLRGIPPSLSHGLPNLGSLHLEYFSHPNQEDPPISPFFTTSHFPLLRTFSFSTSKTVFLLSHELQALMTFLTRHSGTLVELSLPQWYISCSTYSGMQAAFASIPLQLRYLRTGCYLAAEFAPVAEWTVDHLYLLWVNNDDGRRRIDLLTQPSVDGVANPFPGGFGGTKTLTLRMACYRDTVLRLDHLPNVFPALEMLYMDISYGLNDGMIIFFRYRDALAQCEQLKRVIIRGFGLGGEIRRVQTYEILRDSAGGIQSWIEEDERERYAVKGYRDDYWSNFSGY
ncbi:hypothetical protein A0H81_07146 [Grifola frondosa]|uniref:F-box domain-containing protein n=1 Tax=Grifola frondosa TaxID=5627 RepID=A0A1C7M7W9_GRIFR|nr:hypothetical protein A0H81_07146 [Grifola frondosa]